MIMVIIFGDIHHIITHHFGMNHILVMASIHTAIHIMVIHIITAIFVIHIITAIHIHMAIHIIIIIIGIIIMGIITDIIMVKEILSMEIQIIKNPEIN
jgi:hypothetical protein